MQFSSFWPINRFLSDATTPGQNGPGSDGNEGVFCIPQTSSITGTSPSECLLSYSGHSLGESYPSAEKQLVYSTVSVDWPNANLRYCVYSYLLRRPCLFLLVHYPIREDCRIGRLQFCKDVRPSPPQWGFWYDAKRFDVESLVSKLWGIWSTPSLPLLPGTL